jgi:hypothetical protein
MKTKENMDGFVISFAVMQVRLQEMEMYCSEICGILKNVIEKQYQSIWSKHSPSAYSQSSSWHRSAFLLADCVANDEHIMAIK